MKPIPSEILGQHVAILGKTRSGKTNSAKLVIEQVATAGSRVCILDPIKADYWGLTSSADGKKPGLPFHILGGQHGHVPLHAGAAAAIADVVASGALRLAIIDMEQFGPRESGPFFAAFMETIFRKIQGVLYLVVDEAHLFAPKEGRGGDESMATYWFKRMASGSGSKGVRLIVSTQRVQELHNTVLSNCDTVIAHRVTFPEDQKRISEWVGSHASKEVLKEIKGSLANLKRGEAWLCSGEAGIFERRQMPLCSTYDNSRTPTEDERRREVKTAQIDQSALRAIIGTAVDEAKANDPKELKKQIADLNSQIAKLQKAQPQVDPAAIEKAAKERDIYWRTLFGPLADLLCDIRGTFGNMDGLITFAIESLGEVQSKAGFVPPASPPRHPNSVHIQPPAVHISPPVRNRQAANGRNPGSAVSFPADHPKAIAKGERAILIACAERESAVARRELTIVTGYKRSSRDAYISRLSAKGYLAQVGTGVSITAEGLAALGDYEPLPTGKALREHWLSQLPQGEASIFKIVLDHYPQAASKDYISEVAGYKRSSRDAYISRLAARELVQADDPGWVKAADRLFE